MKRRRSLDRVTDEELLDLRLARLPLAVEGTAIEARVERLYADLERRGITFRPHVWLSTYFFSPDGVPGLAIPFYLAHPRLVRLERRHMGWAEGARERDCLALLRHEAGHAIDTAYRLSWRADWRRAFGLRSRPYPWRFRVSPFSRDYVRHLPHWYAQSHPAEDFAETFAVWLTPGSRWRSEYPDGRARRKLEVVGAMMRELAGKRPSIRIRERTESLPSLSGTLREHYEERLRQRRAEPPAPYEAPLRALFACRDAGRRSRSRRNAASFVQEHRAEVQRRLPAALRRDPYPSKQVLDAMVLYCREQGLRLKAERGAPRLSRLAAMVMDTIEALARGRYALSR